MDAALQALAASFSKDAVDEEKVAAVIGVWKSDGTKPEKCIDFPFCVARKFLCMEQHV